MSYVDRVTNQEVLRIMKCKRPSIIHDIEKRQLQYFGHVIRDNSMQRRLMEGVLEGTIGVVEGQGIHGLDIFLKSWIWTMSVVCVLDSSVVYGEPW